VTAAPINQTAAEATDTLERLTRIQQR